MRIFTNVTLVVVTHAHLNVRRKIKALLNKIIFVLFVFKTEIKKNEYNPQHIHMEFYLLLMLNSFKYRKNMQNDSI